MKKILFTGFEPFGKDTTNPSWDAVALLPEVTGEVVIAKRRLPVVYDEVASLLRQAIEEEKPDAVICVGQAGGRGAITPERVAINLKEAGAPDNAGVSYVDTAIDGNGPTAYFATIPVREIVEEIKKAEIPAGISYSAGAYVCNCTMYALLHMLAQDYPGVLGGFIHVPYEDRQVPEKDKPSLPLEVIAKGLEVAAHVTAGYCGFSRDTGVE